MGKLNNFDIALNISIKMIPTFLLRFVIPTKPYFCMNLSKYK